jgi:hypothetical protein
MSQDQAAESKIRTLTGKLVVIGQDIAIEGGPILALCGEDDELGAAVRAYGDLEGQEATVTGTDNFIGGLPVFCISSLTAATVTAPVANADMQKTAPKKTIKRASRKKS